MKKLFFLLFAVMAVFTGCSTLHQGGGPSVQKSETWVVLPFVNNTETPYAAERAEAITSALLYANGIQKVLSAPADTTADAEPLPTDRGLKRRQEALEWARKQGAKYALSGTVTEWRYKVGLDGEPVAGMTMQLTNLAENRVVWSGSSGKSGWSREAVSAVAQQVLESLIGKIPVK